MVIDVRPASVFEDVRTLVGPKSPTANVCWCLSYRVPAKLNSELIGPARGEYVADLCRGEPAPGVLAYDGDTPVGWAAVAPRSDTSFARSRKIPHVDDLPVWSLWCIRVRPGHRRQGISHALITGAVEFAREHGAPAVALQLGRIVREIRLVDVNQDLVEGQALDLLHGAALVADQKIVAGGPELSKDADVICITAGLRRKPDESRLDLINRNVALFVQILDTLKSAGLRKEAHIFVVSNPVDILTQLAVQRCGLPWQQVYGLGTMLDTARFSSFIADELHLAPTQVKALILGEHGDSMVPIWSSATVNGLPLAGLPECEPLSI